MKEYCEVEVQVYTFLASALDRFVVTFASQLLHAQGKSP